MPKQKCYGTIFIESLTGGESLWEYRPAKTYFVIYVVLLLIKMIICQMAMRQTLHSGKARETCSFERKKTAEFFLCSQFGH